MTKQTPPNTIIRALSAEARFMAYIIDRDEKLDARVIERIQRGNEQAKTRLNDPTLPQKQYDILSDLIKITNHLLSIGIKSGQFESPTPK